MILLLTGLAAAALLFAGVVFGGGNAGHVIPIGTLVVGTLAACGALGQLFVAQQRHEKQSEADFQRRIIESFTKAVEQLAGDKLVARLGGIYALERISKESPGDYRIVMETLTAFIREQARWEDDAPQEGPTDEQLGRKVLVQTAATMPRTDISATFAVIARRSADGCEIERQEGWRLDLSQCDLRGITLAEARLTRLILRESHLERADLFRAHLEDADLSAAHLQGVRLEEAHLEGANLRRTHLERAILVKARLERAKLEDVYLTGAILAEAHLEKADLTGARLENAIASGVHLEDAFLVGALLKGTQLQEAHLERTNFTEANLDRAYLSKAHLEGANLTDACLKKANLIGAYLNGANLAQANLEGALLDKADLRQALNLTQYQINLARGDKHTRLPDGLIRPPRWVPDGWEDF